MDSEGEEGKEGEEKEEEETIQHVHLDGGVKAVVEASIGDDMAEAPPDSNGVETSPSDIGSFRDALAIPSGGNIGQDITAFDEEPK